MKNNNHFLLKRSFIVLIVIMMAYLALPKKVRAAEVVETLDISATSSDNVTATLYDDGKLVISGTGAMKDYDWGNYFDFPWSNFQNKIKSVEIKLGITRIGNLSFCDCKNITSITIPNTVTSIGGGAFLGCSNLINVTIPNGLISIEENAFAHCASLKSITIPKSVTSIGKGPFWECSSLAEIEVNGENLNYLNDENGILYNKKMTEIICLPAGNKITSLTIPNTVTSVGEGAFYGCSNLISIKIPDTVTSIGGGAFYDCKNITSIEIPSSVIKIGEGAFWNCEKLTNIKIPNGVTKIESRTFQFCNSLTSLEIPSSVTSIEDFAFMICGNLKSVKIQNGVENIGNLAFWACYSLTDITIPNTVTSIGEDAFCVCKNLTSVTIPESVTSIGDDAFEDCSEDVTIYGYKDSTAEEYAKANNIKFSYLNESKNFSLTIDPAGGEMLLPKTSNSEAQTTTEAYDNLEFTYGEKRLFMTTAYRATTTDKSQAWLGTYSGKAINGNNLMIKDGYKFKEWKIISGEGQIIDEQVDDGENGTIHNYYFDGNCEGDVVIQAQWEALPTITVDPNGAEMTIKKNEKTTQPQTITFYPGNQEKRVFAKVGKISGAGKSQDKWFGFTKMNDLNVPYRKGYIFDGWKITSGSGQLSEEQDDEGRYTYYYDCSYNGNVTIQAQWTLTEKTKYTVNYDANGGTGAPVAQQKNENEALTISTVKPTREGYIFQGWATSNKATTAEYQSGATYNKDENMTLYAVWKKEEVIEIELTSITIKTENVKKNYYLGEKLNIEGIEVTAHYNNGTTTDVTADTVYSGFDSTTVGTKTITATYNGKTATFEVIVKEEIKTFNLTIDPAGGEMLLPKNSNSEAQTTTEAYDNLEFTYGEKRLFMTTAYRATTTDKSQAWLGTYSGKAINGDNLMIKDGYKFKEWKIISGEGQIIDEPVDDGENGTIHNYYFDGNCEGDVLIQAQWEALPTITVDPNGAEMTIKKNEKTTQPQIITFYPRNQEKRVFAKVGKISGAENSQDKWFGFTRMNDLNVPYRKGYTFDGWKITSGSGQLSEEQDDEGLYKYYYDCSSTENVIIQAQWKKDKEVEAITIGLEKEHPHVKAIKTSNNKNYIIVEKGTTVKQVKDEIKLNIDDCLIVIKNKASNETSNDDMVSTDYKLTLEEHKDINATILINGDMDLNGKVEFSDVLLANTARLNNNSEELSDEVKVLFEAKLGKTSGLVFDDIVLFNSYRLKINQK